MHHRLGPHFRRRPRGLGTTKDEGIAGAPNSANINLSSCAAYTPPNIPGE